MSTLRDPMNKGGLNFMVQLKRQPDWAWPDGECQLRTATGTHGSESADLLLARLQNTWLVSRLDAPVELRYAC